ncbi:hypothetical protein D3C80_1817150 [compost metagenome]
MPAQFMRQRLGQPGQCMFGGRIGSNIAVAELRGDRSGVDDPRTPVAPGALDQLRDRRPAQTQDRIHIHFEGVVPHLVKHRCHR